MFIELWKEVEGYEGSYFISNTGHLKTKTRVSRFGRFTRVLKARPLKKILKSTGYEQVTLYKNGVAERVLVHRLVASHFILNPDNKPQVNHIDGYKANNDVRNLEWATQSENTLHAYQTLGAKTWNRGIFGKDAPKSRAVEQLDMKGNLIKRWECASDAVREGGFDSGQISRVAHGKSSHHRGYLWKYV